MTMSTYPVAYTQDPPETRNRLTVFFRLICVIPHVILAFLYGIAFFLAVVVAWFAIVFTGRWPAGLYDFATGFLRYSARLYAYLYLITDVYPPFDGGEHPEYPVQLVIAPPKESYSRAKAFFRAILAIPIYIVQYVFSIWLFVVAVALWIVAVITGQHVGGTDGGDAHADGVLPARERVLLPRHRGLAAVRSGTWRGAARAADAGRGVGGRGRGGPLGSRGAGRAGCRARPRGRARAR